VHRSFIFPKDIKICLYQREELGKRNVAREQENGATILKAREMSTIRDGEEALETDPATMPPDDHVIFIGRIQSPWTSRETCPKNMHAARETGRTAALVVAPPYRKGLTGLERASHVVILSWLDRSERNLIIQKPRHAAETLGVFALRSPVRPNPVGCTSPGCYRSTSIAAVWNWKPST